MKTSPFYDRLLVSNKNPGGSQGDDFKTAKKYIEQEDFSEPLPVKIEKPKATDPYKAWRKTLKNDPGFSHLVWYPGEAQADSVILIQGMKKAM